MSTDEFKDVHPEDVAEIIEEINQEINSIGNVTDIDQQIPLKEDLMKLKEMIDKMPEDQAAEFLSKIINGDKINPNNNSYSAIKQEEIRKQKLKQKIEQKKIQRMSKFGQNSLKEKWQK